MTPLKRTRLAALVGVALLAAAAIGWTLPVRAWMLRLSDVMAASGPLGIILFFVAYTASTVAMLPGSPLTLVAGFAYGPLGGLLVASPASVVAATAAFVLGRTLFRSWVLGRVERSPRARAVQQAVAREGFKLVLLLRLSPLLPFNLLNYVLGVSGIGLRPYVIASFVGMLPGTAWYAYLGSLIPVAAGLREPADGGSTATVLLVAGRLAALGAIFLVTRTATRALKTELQRGRETDAESQPVQALNGSTPSSEER